MQDWRVFSKKADFTAVGSRFNIDPVVARIIRNRDIIGDEAIDKFLNGTITDLYSPNLMKDLTKSVKILSDSIRSGEQIRIIGDYDIDGICSIYILFKGLKSLGAVVDYDIPDRVTDGYGINENLIKKAWQDGVKVILTCDNGIAAVEQIAYAKELGMKVIVTDHHDLQYVDDADGRKYLLPMADAVVNPKQPDCPYPYKMLCGAGVAYKLISMMCDSEKFIPYAAIATVGDIVDLTDENRIIVKTGLSMLKEIKDPGLCALMQVNGIDKAAISTYHIGFVIGPCLNASGRLDTAKRALELLLTEDEDSAYGYAEELKALNEERKKLTSESVLQAFEIMERDNINENPIPVIYLPDCHESIAGIVAGRIKDAIYKPVIVVTDSENGLKGSARSIDGVNIFEKIMECSELLTRFGGHAMAAGLSLSKENLDLFRIGINAECKLTEKDFVRTIWIDVPLPVEYLNENLVKELELLAPFGKANPKPVFADKGFILQNVRPIGKNSEYTRMTLQKPGGIRIAAVGFFPYDELYEAAGAGQKVSVTYYPEIDEFRGESHLQICVTGYRIEEGIS